MQPVPLRSSPPVAHVSQITKDDLAHAEAALGDFGGDNRAGVEGTLHRISGADMLGGLLVGVAGARGPGAAMA